MPGLLEQPRQYIGWQDSMRELTKYIILVFVIIMLLLLIGVPTPESGLSLSVKGGI
jgi:hypothetical protein